MAVKYHRIGCGGQCPVNGLDSPAIGFIPHQNKLIAVNSSVKVAKGLKKKYDTGIVYLSPYWSFDGSHNLCPSASPGCRSTCLVTSGQLKNPAPKQSQLDKTNFWLTDPNGFLSQAHKEIESMVKSHSKVGSNNFTIRLNGTSDIPFEKKSYTYNGVKYKSIMDAFPNVQFYDYTKIYDRLGNTPKNYHLTFSASEINTEQWKKALERGFQVAMVFGSQPGKVSKATGKYKKVPDPLPKTYKGYKVVDGDDTDLTFTRPNGVIIGLRMKGKAENDTTGFVKRDYPQVNVKYPKLNPKTNVPNIISPRSSTAKTPKISKPTAKQKLAMKKKGIGALQDDLEIFADWFDDGNVSYDGKYYSTQDAQYRNKLTASELIEYYFKEYMERRLVKGSKEAKAYMAKLRSMRSVGSTLYLEKGETRKTKPKRIVQVQRTKKGVFKKFSTISGYKKGSTPFFEEGERTRKGGILVKRRKTNAAGRKGTFKTFKSISGVPSSMGAVGIAIGDVKKHSDLIAYYKDHIEKTKNYLKANSRSMDMRSKAAMRKDIAEHMKTIAHHKKMLSQAKKMIK